MKYGKEGEVLLTKSQKEVMNKAQKEAIENDGGRLKHLVKKISGKATSFTDILREDAEKENFVYDPQAEFKKPQLNINEGKSIKTIEEINKIKKENKLEGDRLVWKYLDLKYGQGRKTENICDYIYQP